MVDNLLDRGIGNQILSFACSSDNIECQSNRAGTGDKTIVIYFVNFHSFLNRRGKIRYHFIYPGSDKSVERLAIVIFGFMQHRIQIVKSQFSDHRSSGYGWIFSQCLIDQVEHLESLLVQIGFRVPPESTFFYRVLFLGFRTTGDQ